jgi:hypothetical protein
MGQSLTSLENDLGRSLTSLENDLERSWTSSGEVFGQR